MSARAPDAFEAELLGTWAEEQARYERGEPFAGTLWSRVSYRMARQRGADRPSPVPGKWNVTDAFQSRFARAVKHLVGLGLLRRRSVHSAEPQPPFAFGYHHHARRDRDVFLTPEGRAWVERQRPTVPPEGTTVAGAADAGGAGFEYVSRAAGESPPPARTYSYSVTVPIGGDEE